MARGKAKVAAAEAPDDLADDVPEWKRQSVERSLRTARARAQERSDRFVAATVELMGEKGGLDFTVQDVVDRARMSIRTFYNFFESKDDLLSAVHETIVAKEVVPRLRKRCERESDPILRIRAYIEGLYELTSDRSPVSRAMTTFANRLAETRPAELDRTFQPQIDLVGELIQGAIEAKRLQPTIDPEKLAYLLHHTVLVIVHQRLFDADVDAKISPEDVWLFCARGIGVDSKVSARR
jgi:AcrR family transcriptional regulator